MSVGTVQCLERVRRLLEGPDAWTQGMFARAGFEGVPPTDPNADCFCLRGAIERASFDYVGSSALDFDAVYWAVYDAVEMQVQRVTGRWRNIIPFNEHPERTQAEVLAVVDAAIVQARKDQERLDMEEFERAIA